MSKKDEALKLALEALEKIYIAPEHEEYIRVWWPACEQAITALREALAEQPAQQDPSAGTQVSKVWWDGEKLMAKQVPLEDFYKPAQHRAWFTVDELNAWADKKLKENPQWAEQPAQQEPVSFLDWYDNAHWGNEDFKAGCRRAWNAALAQRTWVGLTDEEIEAEFGFIDELMRHCCCRIEAKLREKNT